MQTNDISHILRLARVYARIKGHTLSTTSLRIANHGSLFGRLESGAANLTLRRRDHIFQVFSNNWPSGHAWPKNIPRPKPQHAKPDREVA